VFFVVYQQLENHLLQPLVFARTVKVNPLTVIIAILIGVELLGVLGALLAIPVASIVQVIARDIWDHRRGQLKEEPTVGEERRPAIAGHEQVEAGPDTVGPPNTVRQPDEVAGAWVDDSEGRSTAAERGLPLASRDAAVSPLPGQVPAWRHGAP